MAALAQFGCILLTRFDDGTQKCDEQAAPQDQCLPGYHCVGGLCVDAGVDGADAGP